ncbi:hypothetical protein [Cognatiyoonia sp.]|uniref:hypothetical protein n=1 Tax=Cognatiyoonia sp. TaxID=2211652 RepID=UPI003F69668F
MDSLAKFQTAILDHLPRDHQPPGPRRLSEENIAPDPLAYCDDLTHAAQVLSGARNPDNVDYITQFLGGVAQSAVDADLQRAVSQLSYIRRHGAPIDVGLAEFSALVQSRRASASAI